MTALAAQSATDAYRLTESLQEPFRSESVLRPAPDEVEFEELLLQKLGPRGWGRLHHFRQYYSPAWGTGAEKPLSPRAVGAFRLFLQNVQFPHGRLPSIFLTDKGGLELCWEDVNSKSVQVEFTSNGIEFYREATDQEGFTDFDEIPMLVQTLNGA